MTDISKMEPFGNGNPEPVLKLSHGVVLSSRRMGSDGQHVKLTIRDSGGSTLQMLAFNAPEAFFCDPGDEISVWFQPNINEWNGRRAVEGQLLHLKRIA